MPDPILQQPALYSPGQFAFQNNAEMSRLISMFAGNIMQNMGGAGTFLPHMTPSQNVYDQHIARNYQRETTASSFFMAGAGNQDVANRLLAMRSMSTDEPASELNKAQAEQFAGLINSPLTKSILGTLIGPENLEAMLHGRKGDVAGLNQAVNRMGFFRNDPSGAKRMDAESLEDFSRGVYAHLYDEGGNLSGTERDVRAVGGTTTDYNKQESVQRLKKLANMENRTVVSDDEVKKRVTQSMVDNQLSAADVETAYKKHVPKGTETETSKQVAALTKFDGAITALSDIVKTASSGKSALLGANDVTVANTVAQARENKLGNDLASVERDVRAVRAVGGDTDEYKASIKSLQTRAKMEDRTVVSDDEVANRINKRVATNDGLNAADVEAAYKKHVGGTEASTSKQVEALTKLNAAIQDLNKTVKDKANDNTGFLGEKEVTVTNVVEQAQKNKLGGDLDNVERDVRAVGGTTTDFNNNANVKLLKQSADMADRTVVSDEEVKKRIKQSMVEKHLSEETITDTYRNYIANGTEATTDKQIEALTKSAPAIKALDAAVKETSEKKKSLLAEQEVTVADTVAQARKKSGGDFGDIEQHVLAVRAISDTTADFNNNANVKLLKQSADMADRTVVSDEEVKKRIKQSMVEAHLSAADVEAAYKEHIGGKETTTDKQIEALTKSGPAIKALDAAVKETSNATKSLLAEQEVTVPNIVEQARKNKLGNLNANIDDVEKNVQAVLATSDTTADFNKQESVQRIKQLAKMEDHTVVSDNEVTNRVKRLVTDNFLTQEDITKTYKKHILGNETDSIRQIEALTKSEHGIEDLDKSAKRESGGYAGLLQDKEVTIAAVVRRARNNRLGEVNGFMAGQVAQITDHMFQRGMLPQAIGAMSPADRVKLLSKERETDPATLTRLAEELGHRELSKTSTTYRDSTPVQQREELKKNLSTYSDQIAAVGAAVDDNRANQKNPKKSVQEIEAMGGYESVAGNVDAKRSAAALKKYTGAVAAVREIFGANGNSNAPMPALLAALDHLSQGASGQMDPKQIETALRSMQEIATGAGIGFEQMASMASQMGATGDMLGIARSQTVHNQVNAMATVKVARDSGVFANPVFGGLNQAEALLFAGEQIQAGAASDAYKSIAALTGLYKASPESYKGTKFEAMIQSYLTPTREGNYSFEGVDYNVHEQLGRGGPQAVLDVFLESGGKTEEFDGAVQNPLSQQHSTGGVLIGQKNEFIRGLSEDVVDGRVPNSVSEDRSTRTDIANAIATLVIDTGTLEPAKQIEAIEAKLADSLVPVFRKKTPTATEAELEQQAEQATTEILGKNPAARKRTVYNLMNDASSYLFDVSGKLMPAFSGLYGGENVQKTEELTRRATAVATRKGQKGINFNTPIGAGVSDYMLGIGEGEQKITFKGMFESLLSAMPDNEFLEMYSEGTAGAFEFVRSELSKVEADAPYINALINPKDENGTTKKTERLEADQLKLKELAGVQPEVQVISDKEFNTRLVKKMENALQASSGGTRTADDNVISAYKRIFKPDAKAAELPVPEQKAALLANETFRAEHAESLLDSKKEISQTQLNVGALRTGEGKLLPLEKRANETTAEFAARQTQQQQVQDTFRILNNSIAGAANPETLTAGMKAAASVFGHDPEKKDETGKLVSKELLTLVRDFSEDPAKDETHKKALAAYVTAQFGNENLLTADEKELPAADKQKLISERTNNQVETYEGFRTARGIDMANVTGSMTQQLNQKIDNARIEATTATIGAKTVILNADSVTSAGKPAAAASATTPGASSPAASKIETEVNKPVVGSLPGSNSPSNNTSNNTSTNTSTSADTSTNTNTSSNSTSTSSTTGGPEPATVESRAPTASTQAGIVANDATSAAQGATAVGANISAEPQVALAGSGMGGQQTTTLTGTLEITNLETGVLTILARQNGPPAQVGGGGSPVFASK